MYDTLMYQLKNRAAWIGLSGYKKDSELMRQAADAIKHLLADPDAAYLEGWKNGEKAAESRMPKWISVDERLPEVGEMVAVYTSESILSLRRVWMDCMVTSTTDPVPHWSNNPGRVLLWMHLPVPPKEET